MSFEQNSPWSRRRLRAGDLVRARLRLRGLPLLLLVAACAAAPEVGNDALRRTKHELVGPAVVVDATADAGVVVTLESSYASCKGTLLTPRLVLTAAHCAFGGSQSPGLAANATLTTTNAAGVVALADLLPTRLGMVSYVNDWDVNKDVALLELDPSSSSISEASWNVLLELPLRKPSFTAPAGAETGSPFVLGEDLAIGGFRDDNVTINALLPVPASTTFKQGNGILFLSTDLLNDLGGYTERGDSGGALYRATPSGRDVVGVTSATVFNPDRYLAFVDLSAPAPSAWIKANAVDGSRTTRWRQSHGGARWKGEVDYAGPCQTAKDPDCDHWYSWRDNCPNVFNPNQEDGDDDGRGDVCDSCVAVPQTDPRRNCNVLAERARDGDSPGSVQELGDACDPVPCPDFYIDRRFKGAETCVPNELPDGGYGGLACSAEFTRPFLLTDPLPSRDGTGAAMNVPEVATARRFCQASEELRIDCMAPRNIRDELLDVIEPTDPDRDRPWHRIKIGGPMAVYRGADTVLNYDANEAFSTTWWRFGDDFNYWASPGTPKLPFDGCTAGDVSCLGGAAWLHARTPVGADVTGRGPGLANSYQPWRPVERLGYCPTNRLPEGLFGLGAADVDFHAEVSDTAVARRGELPWPAFDRSPYRVIDLDEHGYVRLLGSTHLGVVASLRADGSAVAASTGTNACSGIDVDLPLSDAITANVWAPLAEPRVGMGRVDARVFSIALEPFGRHVVDTAVEVGGRAALGSAHGLADWLDGAHGPPALVEYVPIFSQVAGGVFVVGGRDVDDHVHHGRVFFRPLGGDWEQIYIEGPTLHRVTAATFSYGDRQLWVADVDDDTNEARVLRIDPAFGTSTVIVRSPNHGRSTFFAVDRDGSALLFVGQAGFFDAVRFALVPEDPHHQDFRVERYARTEARLTRIPMVDDRAYQFVEAVPENGSRTLRIRRRPSLTRVCCNGTACSSPDLCLPPEVGGLL